MIRKQALGAKDACIIAIAALDELVNDLVKASGLSLPRGFLDWIADEATPLVEHHLVHYFSSPRFADSLRMGDPRIALARWVRHWVRPRILACFGELAVYLPEFGDSRPAKPLPAPALAAAALRQRQRHALQAERSSWFISPGRVEPAPAGIRYK
jgi:hypothetical protein